MNFHRAHQLCNQHSNQEREAPLCYFLITILTMRNQCSDSKIAYFCNQTKHSIPSTNKSNF